MTDLTIKLPGHSVTHSCGLCGRCISAASGPNLCLNNTQEVVCVDCGKQHAPALVALLDLAHVAQRVGKIHRNTLVPSFHELLDLARAAENYCHTTHAPLTRAA